MAAVATGWERTLCTWPRRCPACVQDEAAYRAIFWIMGALNRPGTAIFSVSSRSPLVTGSPHGTASTAGTVNRRRGSLATCAQQGEQWPSRPVGVPKEPHQTENCGIGIKSVQFAETFRGRLPGGNGLLPKHVFLDYRLTIILLGSALWHGRQQRLQVGQHDRSTAMRTPGAATEAETCRQLLLCIGVRSWRQRSHHAHSSRFERLAGVTGMLSYLGLRGVCRVSGLFTACSVSFSKASKSAARNRR